MFLKGYFALLAIIRVVTKWTLQEEKTLSIKNIAKSQPGLLFFCVSDCQRWYPQIPHIPQMGEDFEERKKVICENRRNLRIDFLLLTSDFERFS